VPQSAGSVWRWGRQRLLGLGGHGLPGTARRDAVAFHHHPLSHCIAHALFVSFWARIDAAAVADSTGFGSADPGEEAYAMAEPAGYRRISTPRAGLYRYRVLNGDAVDVRFCVF
jgi:hypothetical protein